MFFQIFPQASAFIVTKGLGIEWMISSPDVVSVQRRKCAVPQYAFAYEKQPQAAQETPGQGDPDPAREKNPKKKKPRGTKGWDQSGVFRLKPIRYWAVGFALFMSFGVIVLVSISLFSQIPKSGHSENYQGELDRLFLGKSHLTWLHLKEVGTKPYGGREGLMRSEVRTWVTDESKDRKLKGGTVKILKDIRAMFSRVYFARNAFADSVFKYQTLYPLGHVSRPFCSDIEASVLSPSMQCFYIVHTSRAEKDDTVGFELVLVLRISNVLVELQMSGTRSARTDLHLNGMLGHLFGRLGEHLRQPLSLDIFDKNLEASEIPPTPLSLPRLTLTEAGMVFVLSLAVTKICLRLLGEDGDKPAPSSKPLIPKKTLALLTFATPQQNKGPKKAPVSEQPAPPDKDSKSKPAPKATVETPTGKAKQVTKGKCGPAAKAEKVTKPANLPEKPTPLQAKDKRASQEVLISASCTFPVTDPATPKSCTWLIYPKCDLLVTAPLTSPGQFEGGIRDHIGGSAEPYSATPLETSSSVESLNSPDCLNEVNLKARGGHFLENPFVGAPSSALIPEMLLKSYDAILLREILDASFSLTGEKEALCPPKPPSHTFCYVCSLCGHSGQYCPLAGELAYLGESSGSL